MTEPQVCAEFVVKTTLRPCCLRLCLQKLWPDLTSNKLIYMDINVPAEYELVVVTMVSSTFKKKVHARSARILFEPNM